MRHNLQLVDGEFVALEFLKEGLAEHGCTAEDVDEAMREATRDVDGQHYFDCRLRGEQIWICAIPRRGEIHKDGDETSQARPRPWRSSTTARTAWHKHHEWLALAASSSSAREESRSAWISPFVDDHLQEDKVDDRGPKAEEEQESRVGHFRLGPVDDIGSRNVEGPKAEDQCKRSTEDQRSEDPNKRRRRQQIRGYQDRSKEREGQEREEEDDSVTVVMAKHHRRKHKEDLANALRRR